MSCASSITGALCGGPPNQCIASVCECAPHLTSHADFVDPADAALATCQSNVPVLLALWTTSLVANALVVLAAASLRVAFYRRLPKPVSKIRGALPAVLGTYGALRIATAAVRLGNVPARTIGHDATVTALFYLSTWAYLVLSHVATLRWTTLFRSDGGGVMVEAHAERLVAVPALVIGAILCASFALVLSTSMYAAACLFTVSLLLNMVVIAFRLRFVLSQVSLLLVNLDEGSARGGGGGGDTVYLNFIRSLRGARAFMWGVHAVRLLLTTLLLACTFYLPLQAAAMGYVIVVLDVLAAGFVLAFAYFEFPWRLRARESMEDDTGRSTERVSYSVPTRRRANSPQLSTVAEERTIVDPASTSLST